MRRWCRRRGAGKGYFYLQQQYKRAAGCHGDGGTVKIEQWSSVQSSPARAVAGTVPGYWLTGEISRQPSLRDTASRQQPTLPSLLCYPSHHHTNNQRSNKCSATRWPAVPVRSSRRLLQIVPQSTNLLNVWPNTPTSAIPPHPSFNHYHHKTSSNQQLIIKGSSWTETGCRSSEYLKCVTKSTNISFIPTLHQYHHQRLSH